MRIASGETVFPADGFRCFATTNVDPSMLREAILSRFAVLEVTDPHPAAIMELPEDLREFAWHSGTSADRERRLDLRAFQRFAAIRQHITGEQGLRIAFGNRAEEVRDALAVAGVAGVVDPTPAASTGY